MITNGMYSEIPHNMTCSVGYSGRCNCSCGAYCTYDKDYTEQDIEDRKSTKELNYNHDIAAARYLPKTKKICVVMRARPRPKLGKF